MQTVATPMANDTSGVPGREPVLIGESLEGMSAVANESRGMFLV